MKMDVSDYGLKELVPVLVFAQERGLVCHLEARPSYQKGTGQPALDGMLEAIGKKSLYAVDLIISDEKRASEHILDGVEQVGQ